MMRPSSNKYESGGDPDSGGGGGAKTVKLPQDDSASDPADRRGSATASGGGERRGSKGARKPLGPIVALAPPPGPRFRSESDSGPGGGSAGAGRSGGGGGGGGAEGGGSRKFLRKSLDRAMQMAGAVTSPRAFAGNSPRQPFSLARSLASIERVATRAQLKVGACACGC